MGGRSHHRRHRRDLHVRCRGAASLWRRQEPRPPVAAGSAAPGHAAGAAPQAAPAQPGAQQAAPTKAPTAGAPAAAPRPASPMARRVDGTCRRSRHRGTGLVARIRRGADDVPHGAADRHGADDAARLRDAADARSAARGRRPRAGRGPGTYSNVGYETAPAPMPAARAVTPPMAGARPGSAMDQFMRTGDGAARLGHSGRVRHGRLPDAREGAFRPAAAGLGRAQPGRDRRSSRRATCSSR